MEKIAVSVTRTEEVELRPYLAFLYFDQDGQRSIRYQYAEYRNGILFRVLAMQEAPVEAATPILDAVEAAMEAKAKEAFAGLSVKDPADYDDNEKYLAALVEAGK